ncbi:MAG: hypothetical protein EKK55_01185 [Rhodocyclaceae bacterium]|nr:MAG: hypothetical protein EKK55_01185 [Rhodocyclaceae bacterium]
MQKNLFPARGCAPGHRSVRDQLDAHLREMVTLMLAAAQGPTPEPAQKAGAVASKAIDMLGIAPRHGRVPQAIRDAVFELQALLAAVAAPGVARLGALGKGLGLLALEWTKLRGRKRWIRLSTLQAQKGRCAETGCPKDARDVIAAPSEGPEVYKGYCRSHRLKHDARLRCARAVSTRMERAADAAGQYRLPL